MSLPKLSLLTDDFIVSSHNSYPYYYDYLQDYHLYPHLPDSLVLRNKSVVLSARKKAVSQPNKHKRNVTNQEEDSKAGSTNTLISTPDGISLIIKEKALTIIKTRILSLLMKLLIP
jgi:hypothetical protein